LQKKYSNKYLNIVYPKPGPYTKISQSELCSESTPKGYFLIIDTNVTVVKELVLEQTSIGKKTPSVMVIILSAPKNAIQRQLTRAQLKKVAHRDVKWAFILGQTTPDIQVFDCYF
jgi:hypothetical protein